MCTQLAWRVGGGMLAVKPVPLAAGGTVCTGLRDYSPGDELNRVNWAICARHDELYVREYRGVAATHAYLFIDTSASMGLNAIKIKTLQRIGATLGYGLLERGSKLTICTYNTGIKNICFPILGVNRVATALQFIKTLGHESILKNHTDRKSHGESHITSPDNTLKEDAEKRNNTAHENINYSQCFTHKTDLLKSVNDFLKLRLSGGQVFIISDFFDPNFEQACTLLQRNRYEPHVLHLTEPQDRGAGLVGDVEIVDVESGYQRIITLTERDLHIYEHLYDAYLDSVKETAHRRGMRYARLSTDMNDVSLILKTLGLPELMLRKNPWEAFIRETRA